MLLNPGTVIQYAPQGTLGCFCERCRGHRNQHSWNEVSSMPGPAPPQTGAL